MPVDPAHVDSDSSSDLSTVALDADTLVDNLVSELGSAAQDADTLVANLTSGSGKPYLCLAALVSQFVFY